ncbi:DASH family cryptochrome [Rubripirellula reticaptiva]|uniref:Cryptochrome DASH n=1 Tax=Rubripirellula reticaptiva TaxID=2528013 RepID=A0A5C6EQ07_9BACT|nr:DASH family cryptochrome [Rubripirellula reticaptiva]TWU51853.1 Cryptochrome DASH [Rubripirellula reticaptiva]
MTISLVWFRNDLRLHDHRALVRAIERSDQTVCVYVLDPAAFGKTGFGFDRIGKFRLQFLRESLVDLRKQLHAVGGTLHVVVGDPADTLAAIAKTAQASSVHCHLEYASEERDTQERVRIALARIDCTLEVASANTLYEVEDLPFGVEELPELFTKFRGKVEKRYEPPSALPPPNQILNIPSEIAAKIPSQDIDGIHFFTSSSIEPDPRGVMSFQGGETAGLARLDDYLWQTHGIRSYKETRNGMMGANYSSKFSPWLAMGCLSPRKIYDEVKRYEQQVAKNDSTYWMFFELLWRDYFAFVVAKHGRRVFTVGGIQQQQYSWNQDAFRFDAWREGRTGYPLIDANMRELARTGFMSNRGRQNAASFLTKNLGVDWRMGAQWFESLLIDYDPCSNYGNWNYIAGVGNDAREFRWFNTIKQAGVYDPDGAYVKHWLPELANVPRDQIHTPWKISGDEQLKFSVGIGVDYPAPIVDLFASADRQQLLFTGEKD